MYRVGVDIGGTFTDLLLVGEEGTAVIGKTLTTPGDPSLAVETALSQALADGVAKPGERGTLVHGIPPSEGGEGEGLKGGWDLAIVPTDAPKVLPENVVMEESIKVALENRPEYKQAEIDLKNKNIQVEYKKNQLHPSLDLVGSLKLNGISGDAEDVIGLSGTPLRSSFGGDYFKSYDRLISGNYYDWSVGLSLQIPLGNRAAASSYTAAKLDIEKGLKSLKNLEHQIFVEVRETVRSIETNKKRVNRSEEHTS